MGHSRNCSTRSKPLCIQQGQTQLLKISSTIFQRDSSFLLRFTGLFGLLWGSLAWTPETQPHLGDACTTLSFSVHKHNMGMPFPACGFALCFQWTQAMLVLGKDSVHGELGCSCHHQGLGLFRHLALCIWRDWTSMAENNPPRDLGAWTTYNPRPCFGSGNQEILFIQVA